MTEKLYYENSKLYATQACVTECTEKDGKYSIVLDKTCFFPEGGGQPSDRGFIDDIAVVDVQEKNEVLYHITEKPIEVGKTVDLCVDEKRRCDHNCQHTGEHILSGLAKTMYEAVNVGFHMADDYSTIDFDFFLNDDQIKKLEYAANAAVRANTRVHCDIVDADTLKKLTLRKKTDGIEEKADKFRIVYIDGVDSCTCCGSHTEYTGEVGIIKITAWQKYKSGIRMWFLCGERAVSDYMEKQIITSGIAKRFSTKESEVMSVVIKQGDELALIKHNYKQKCMSLARYRAEELLRNAETVRGTKIIVSVEENADMNELKMLAENIVNENAMCVLISSAQDGLIYVLASAKGVTPPMNELCKTFNAMFGGKGGGRAEFVQGKAANMGESQLEQSVSQFENYIKNAINK